MLCRLLIVLVLVLVMKLCGRESRSTGVGRDLVIFSLSSPTMVAPPPPVPFTAGMVRGRRGFEKQHGIYQEPEACLNENL